jgi:hypothetical protein
VETLAQQPHALLLLLRLLPTTLNGLTQNLFPSLRADILSFTSSKSEIVAAALHRHVDILQRPIAALAFGL